MAIKREFSFTLAKLQQKHELFQYFLTKKEKKTFKPPTIPHLHKIVPPMSYHTCGILPTANSVTQKSVRTPHKIRLETQKGIG